MTIAYWMILVAALLPYFGTSYAKFADGGRKTYDNHAPRAQIDTWPPKRRRAYWAQLNGFETFPLFAAAVIIAHVAGAPQRAIDTLAVAYVVTRMIYTAFYIYDKATLRSITWTTGLLCVIGLFIAASNGSTA